ncbi:MAG: TRAP transporter small permease [Firmicutes bacterium]|nr:TRAP transporter small permease [Bacillota bacterium]
MEKISNVITNILRVVCGLVLAALVIIITIEVVSRWMSIAMPWTDELARYLLIWMTFLGCSLALASGTHLSVDFIVKMFPKNGQKALNIITRVLIIVFFGIIMIYGTKLSIAAINTKSTALHWSMGIVYSILPLSGLLSVFYAVMDIIHILKGDGKEEEQ